MAGIRSRAIGALVAAELVSVLGTRMTYLALPWFVLVTTGSPAKMSVVLAVQIAPIAILGIPSGALVARLGSRTAMLVADFARAPLIMALPVLHSLGVLSFGLVLVLVALLGAFMAPYFASQRVILPELVGEDERTMSQANSLIEGGSSAANLAGPGLAGILIPFIGAPNVLYIDAATYVVAFLLVLVFVPRPTARTTDQAPSGFLDGLRYLVGDSLLRPLVVTLVGFGFLGSALSAALPAHAFLDFGGSSRVAGLFYAGLGAGALIGSVLAVALIPRAQPLRIAGVAILGVTLPLWALGFDLPAWAFTLALFASTLFAPLVNGPILGAVTARIPRELRAKVMTAIIALNTAAAPAGFLLAGQVIEQISTRVVFVTVAAGFTATGLVFAAVVLRHAGALVTPTPSGVAATRTA